MILRTITLFIVVVVTGYAQTSFQVVRKKPLWPDAEGTLVIDEAGVEFRRGEGQSKSWPYEEIQGFDRISPTEIEVLTYEDVAWRLGQDRSYRFALLSGEIDDTLFESMTRKIGRPVTDRIVEGKPDDAPQLPVKHLKPFGGSEGELIFGESAIYYATDAPRQSREWRLDRDVDSVWAAHRYQLELHVFEAGRHDFDDVRVYRFQLKDPLDPDLYRNLKLRLYGLRAEDRVIP
ncbi:MAG: hypothetical protein GC160_15460 [Acidobacteria bacterium]|nr:hypothetical protein [Acidobacteriota bacterium]